MIGKPFQIATESKIGQIRTIDRTSQSGEPIAAPALAIRTGYGVTQRTKVLPASLIMGAKSSLELRTVAT
jgi:hypothetical protein